MLCLSRAQFDFIDIPKAEGCFTEAEYRSIVADLAEITWLHSLLVELHLSTSVPIIFSDNLGVVLMSANPVLHSRSKYFKIDLHYIRDFVQQKMFEVGTPSSQVSSYRLTKPLSGASFLRFRDKLRVVHNPILSLRGDVI